MVHLSDGCIVCKSAVLVGDISIGSGTVVHPFARIIAKTGPVVIGDNNIIEEMAEIVNDDRERRGGGLGVQPQDGQQQHRGGRSEAGPAHCPPLRLCPHAV